jgi:hypothetical protein
MFGVGVAPAHEEPRSGSNNSAHESTSGRSTPYGSGHLIRVFRDIGRIFSLLFLLSHPSPVGHPPRRRVQSQSGNMVSSKAKNGFNCVSCGTYRGEEASCVSFAKTWTPPERVQNLDPAGACDWEGAMGGVLGNPHGWVLGASGNEGSAAEHMSAPEVPVMQSARFSCACSHAAGSVLVTPRATTSRPSSTDGIAARGPRLSGCI